MTTALGWTLVHFLWQGSAIGLLIYMFAGFSRRPQVRYVAGVMSLIGMIFSPATTFIWLMSRHQQSAAPSNAVADLTNLGALAATAEGKIPIVHAAKFFLSSEWTTYFVWAWLIGVAVFAIRAVGGYLVVRRLLRKLSVPITSDIGHTFYQLQKRLAISHTVRYLQSQFVASPAVVGWFRPTVLLPISALSGLTCEQLEIVIAHELAHIRRWDALVNLFQIIVETVLFYHPAVWWLNRFIRNEREHCCDDAAIEACGHRQDYARALALMETWRTAPTFAVAANGGSLKGRIARILGVESLTQSVPHRGLITIGTLCLAATVFAGATLRSSAAVHDDTSVRVEPPMPIRVAPTPPAAPEIAADPILPKAPVLPEAPVLAEVPVLPKAPAIPKAPLPARSNGRIPSPPTAPIPPTEEFDQTSSSRESSASYIGGLQNAGLADLDVDTLIALKVQGVTPEYVKGMRSAGFEGSARDLIAMKVQGVSPDYVKKVRDAGWTNASMRQILEMKVQGVDPAEAEQLKRELGGSDVSLREIITFKIQGVTPEYIRGLRAAGLKDLSGREIVSAKIQGVTPEFVQRMREQGFKDLSLRQLIRLKTAGIF